ncbi:glycoside hydrolase family 3 protein [Kineococcus indalonis]|uniref:glycoside hydrolase family 3 protein n=1 Tax=Kineococcus indalonis TaxID=2696566 RepID=UPI001412861D|nr:glycoside hydrolase family 3 protein [Kineococcus indalonis]NAZ84810.1 glycoside hydrolase family 3 protein [Kineococcus indalonis]
MTVPKSSARAFALALLVAGTSLVQPLAAGAAPRQERLETRSAPLLSVGGLKFKDLDRDGALDRYEDWRREPAQRAEDLLSQMTLQEKAGTMVHGTAPTPWGGPPAYDLTVAREVIAQRGVTSLLTRLSGPADVLAQQSNALQEIAEGARLGVPLTISTDPRNHFQHVAGASVPAGAFSQWPEPLGFGAARDAALTRRFADTARQEYRAVGITTALSPQADLATEPRWSRINGTFGEDAAVVERMTREYVRGFQHGKGVDPQGVQAVVKHWGGYGAAQDGFDSHNPYGKYATFSSDAAFEDHLDAFRGAFGAEVAGVMPTYSIVRGATVDGEPLEQVAAGYNRQVLTDLLRGDYGYRGVVISDWGITEDCVGACLNGAPAGQQPSFTGFGAPWGVERLSRDARFVKGVQAGIDQFGGTEDPSPIVRAVQAGRLTTARVDASVRRILVQKFEQGLFEDPYVDPAAAARTVGRASFQKAATAAQQRASVLLANAAVPTGKGKKKKQLLPLAGGTKVYLHGIAAQAARDAGLTVVATPAEADVAIARTATPFETLHPQYVFGRMQHEGNLAFAPGQPDFDAIAAISAQVPTVVSVYADRPPVLTRLLPEADALLLNFGITDEALLGLVRGEAEPRGKLPFELPSSMAAVEDQLPDVPADSAAPLFRLGAGLRY